MFTLFNRNNAPVSVEEYKQEYQKWVPLNENIISEKRYARDGSGSYTRDEFVELYGGTAEWDAALRQRADRYVYLCPHHQIKLRQQQEKSSSWPKMPGKKTLVGLGLAGLAALGGHAYASHKNAQLKDLEDRSCALKNEERECKDECVWHNQTCYGKKHARKYAEGYIGLFRGSRKMLCEAAGGRWIPRFSYIEYGGTCAEANAEADEDEATKEDAITKSSSETTAHKNTFARTSFDEWIRMDTRTKMALPVPPRWTSAIQSSGALDFFDVATRRYIVALSDYTIESDRSKLAAGGGIQVNYAGQVNSKKQPQGLGTIWTLDPVNGGKLYVQFGHFRAGQPISALATWEFDPNAAAPAWKRAAPHAELFACRQETDPTPLYVEDCQANQGGGVCCKGHALAQDPSDKKGYRCRNIQDHGNNPNLTWCRSTPSVQDENTARKPTPADKTPGQNSHKTLDQILNQEQQAKYQETSRQWIDDMNKQIRQRAKEQAIDLRRKERLRLAQSEDEYNGVEYAGVEELIDLDAEEEEAKEMDKMSYHPSTGTPTTHELARRERKIYQPPPLDGGTPKYPTRQRRLVKKGDAHNREKHLVDLSANYNKKYKEAAKRGKSIEAGHLKSLVEQTDQELRRAHGCENTGRLRLCGDTKPKCCTGKKHLYTNTIHVLSSNNDKYIQAACLPASWEGENWRACRDQGT